ncbi:MAG: hypothetical protein OJF50_005801 [Nitrospira sp.]|nr:hypothetical protein [Nitrospira sp.]
MYKTSITQEVMSINHLSARNGRFHRTCMSCGNHSIGGETCHECKKSSHPERANHQKETGEIANYVTVPHIQRRPAPGQGARPSVIPNAVLHPSATADTQFEPIMSGGAALVSGSDSAQKNLYRPATGPKDISVLGVGNSASRGTLTVSDPFDPFEREAVRISDLLFPLTSIRPLGRETDSDALSGSAPQAGMEQGISASCGSCRGQEKLPLGIADRGSPLPEQTKGEMQDAFGADFSDVRIHTNSGASRVTRSLKAEAFTFGNEIFFDQGRYDPHSLSGKRLLAHELTHALQQRKSIAMLARQGEGKTTLQCVNENLSSAGVASWLLAIVGLTCGLVGALAGSPTGPGAAGTAAAGAAICIAGVIGFSVGAVLGILTGCMRDPNFRSRGANPR